MTEYPAGTVAVATVRGVPQQRVIRYDTGHEAGWYAAVGLAQHQDDESVTDVRPLVVLDLETVAPEAIVEALRNRHAEALNGMEGSTGWGRVADQIEAQTQPPRIPEPGLWGVVEAAWDSGGYVWQWVHHPKGCWLNAEGESAGWDHLIDPTLVRPGIEDAS